MGQVLHGSPTTTEALVELTYQDQVTSWLVLRPDPQYVINPGGGMQGPNNPNHALRNEFIAGTRSVVTF